ncbi:hypothetical protein RCL_jg16031.t1 [Rhizophagus clarus]|uniref:Uncharacterized protein n=1 Tax=Rhizophagus clarus TaxID=94130 RepID=A0A8H3LCT3_9GLOM|nr:hypothetical protein RCL_jg16031.t1 [Rhizophagus clarus]
MKFKNPMFLVQRETLDEWNHLTKEEEEANRMRKNLVSVQVKSSWINKLGTNTSQQEDLKRIDLPMFIQPLTMSTKHTHQDFRTKICSKKKTRIRYTDQNLFKSSSDTRFVSEYSDDTLFRVIVCRCFCNNLAS